MDCTGPEDLISGNDIVILHIAEDRGLNAVALVPQALAATLQLGALLLPLLAHVQNLVKLLLGHLHTQFGIFSMQTQQLVGMPTEMLGHDLLFHRHF